MKQLLISLPLLTLALCSPVLGQDFKRFEIQPFGGFTASGSIPRRTSDNLDQGSVHVDSSFNAGGNLAINLNELDAVEAHWQRQFTEGRLGASTFTLKIDQLHCNFIHHYRVADPKARPYVMAGLGVTTYYADGHDVSDSKSHFSFALGGGMKYYFTSRFGFRGEARWSPTVLSSSNSDVWCKVAGGATCEISLKTAVQHQLDLTAGLVFRF